MAPPLRTRSSATLRWLALGATVASGSAHFVVTYPPSLSGITVETATLRHYGPQASTLPSTSVVWLDSDTYCSPSPSDVINKIVATDRRNALCDDAYAKLASAGTCLLFKPLKPSPECHPLPNDG